MNTLSLLSGGEKTMAAAALILSVFLQNPSPICVLDEVDAPLDDINIDKYCKVIKKINQEGHINDWRYFQGIVINYSPKWIDNLHIGFIRWTQMYHSLVNGDYFWMEGKPATEDILSPSGAKLGSVGEVRDGGSYEDRMGGVACWNATMDENKYMVRKWNEMVAA